MSCNHCQLMSEYYSAREAQEQEAESYSYGYDTELEDYYAEHPKLTFKVFLIGRKGVNSEE